MEHATMVRFVLWGLGTCIGGFLFLAGWCWVLKGGIHKAKEELEKEISEFKIKTVEDMKDRITYEWFERHFEKKLAGVFKEFTESIKNVERALMGTIDKPGVISKIHDHEKRLEELEDEEKEI